MTRGGHQTNFAVKSRPQQLARLENGEPTEQVCSKSNRIHRGSINTFRSRRSTARFCYGRFIARALVRPSGHDRKRDSTSKRCNIQMRRGRERSILKSNNVSPASYSRDASFHEIFIVHKTNGSDLFCFQFLIICGKLQRIRTLVPLDPVRSSRIDAIRGTRVKVSPVHASYLIHVLRLLNAVHDSITRRGWLDPLSSRVHTDVGPPCSPLLLVDDSPSHRSHPFLF